MINVTKKLLILALAVRGTTGAAAGAAATVPRVQATNLPADFGASLATSIRTSVAASLGMTIEDVSAARATGTNLESLAAAAGLDLEALREQALQQFLVEGVSNGQISEMQADQIADRFHNQQQGADAGGQQGRGGGKQGGGKKGNKKKKRGAGRTGGFGKPKAGAQIEGLREAVETAVKQALGNAGIQVADSATKAEMKEAMTKAKEAGLDLGAVKQAAMKDFVTQGAAAGTISAEVAADFLDRAAQREKMQQVREGLEDAVAAAIAKALGLTAEELTAMDNKEGRQQLQEQAAAAGVDLKEVKSQAVDAFVQAAVAEGALTAEEAAELQQRRGDHKGGGARKGKGGARKGKKGGRKTGGFGQAQMKVRAAGNQSGKQGKMARFAQRFNGQRGGQAPAAAPQQSAAAQDPVAPPGAALTAPPAAPQDAMVAPPGAVAFRSFPAADSGAASTASANTAGRPSKGGNNRGFRPAGRGKAKRG